MFAIVTGVPGALRSVCKAWLVAMPICAAHLVLVTASGVCVWRESVIFVVLGRLGAEWAGLQLEACEG